MKAEAPVPLRPLSKATKPLLAHQKATEQLKELRNNFVSFVKTVIQVKGKSF